MASREDAFTTEAFAVAAELLEEHGDVLETPNGPLVLLAYAWAKGNLTAPTEGHEAMRDAFARLGEWFT